MPSVRRPWLRLLLPRYILFKFIAIHSQLHLCPIWWAGFGITKAGADALGGQAVIARTARGLGAAIFAVGLSNSVDAADVSGVGTASSGGFGAPPQAAKTPNGASARR